jgi:predicted DNA-binding transcriptional regulator YafY
VAIDFYKQDRVMRLMRVLTLFLARPHGLTTQEVAERLEVTSRTVQRDILHLQSDLHVPFVRIGTRWTVPGDYWLRPVTFNVHEAVAMLLSARLMLRYADKANPFATAAFEKVAAALPGRVKEPVMEVADSLHELPVDQTFVKVLAALTSAWSDRRQVVVTYSLEATFERRLWPLFIEPNPTGHTCYLIAWDPKANQARNYKLERISAVTVLDERFSPPLGFSLGRYLSHAWGIWTTSDSPVEIELRFDPSVARRVKETTWHQSQEVEDLADGSVRVRLLVSEPRELKHWVLGWGSACEVVKPAAFRAEVAAEAAAMAHRYEEAMRPAVMLEDERRAG